ncbi:MAG: DNA polymerase Y family protein [Proteobacteria bacterium]|nr:DNA polymerase Y family protein [Pseudomonadota bacterium]
MQRIICIWLPFLESERLARQNPELSQKPFVLVAREANRVFVSALSKSAGKMGFAADMSLVDVRAAAPDMLYHEMDPEEDVRCLRGLMRWASRFTPRVARGEGSNLYLDIAGASHLFGGERALLETIHAQLQAFGFTARLALADNQAVAWGFAHYGQNKSNITADILREASRDLSVEALQMSYASTTLCQRLGLKKIGTLLDLPRAALASRIGLEDLKQVDRFFGSAAEARQFARYRERLIEEKQFFDPLATSAGVEAALDELLGKLCVRLSQMQRGFRKASLWMDRVDHQSLSFSVLLMQPSIDITVLKRLFSRHFEQLDVGFGIDRMRLGADQVAPLSQRQLGLEESKKQNHDDNRNKLVNELSNMFGARQVRQFSPADSHIPEHTFTQRSALHLPSRPQSWNRPAVKRPIRLLKNPVSVLVCDGIYKAAPEQIFWHGRECRLTPLTGPERIEPNWWRQDPDWQNGSRDYWWVKTHFGALLWLYRVSHEEKTQWFVHGMGS